MKTDDSRMKEALNMFFQDFVDSLSIRFDAEELLAKAANGSKVGLISNFTYSPVIYASLRKLGISKFFDAILVSHECSWRKPHQKIFDDALRRLRVKPAEAVFLGDSPNEDIKGALQAELKTVFVASQFNTMETLKLSGQKPHMSAVDLKEICDRFSNFVLV